MNIKEKIDVWLVLSPRILALTSSMKIPKNTCFCAENHHQLFDSAILNIYFHKQNLLKSISYLYEKLDNLKQMTGFDAS